MIIWYLWFRFQFVAPICGEAEGVPSLYNGGLVAMDKKKERVITARTVLKIVTVLAVLSAIVYAIVSIASGIPILEVLTDPSNLPIWLGILASVIIVLATGDVKDKKCES